MPLAATGCAGSIPRLLRRIRCRTGARRRALSRPRRDRGDARRAVSRATAGAGVSSRPVVAQFDAVRATMLAGFPPVRGAAAAARAGSGPAARREFGAAAAGLRAGLGGRLFRATGPGRGCTARRCTATSRRAPPGSAIAVAYLNLLGHAVGWPSPRGRRRAADRRARVVPARAGRRVRTGARVDADRQPRRRASAAWRSPGATASTRMW